MAWYDNNLVMTGGVDVTVNGYGTTVAFTDTASGSSVALNAGDNTIKDLQNGSINGASVAGNTFLDLSNASGLTAQIQVGAYSTFVDGRNLDTTAGARSTFDGCTGGSITTGSDSHIDKFLQGTITAGIKTVAGEIDTSFVEPGRDSTVHSAFRAVGGSGSDLFVANSSMNMTGGTGGGNTFDIMKTAAGARDVITDFTAAKHNTIDLTGFGLTQSGLADVLDHAAVSSAGLALHLNSNTTLTVADVHDTNNRTASNFLLLS